MRIYGEGSGVDRAHPTARTAAWCGGAPRSIAGCTGWWWTRSRSWPASRGRWAFTAWCTCCITVNGSRAVCCPHVTRTAAVCRCRTCVTAACASTRRTWCWRARGWTTSAPRAGASGAVYRFTSRTVCSSLSLLGIKNQNYIHGRYFFSILCANSYIKSYYSY